VTEQFYQAFFRVSLYEEAADSKPQVVHLGQIEGGRLKMEAKATEKNRGFNLVLDSIEAALYYQGKRRRLL
jgi:hypothetical protein